MSLVLKLKRQLMKQASTHSLLKLEKQREIDFMTGPILHFLAQYAVKNGSPGSHEEGQF